MRTIKKDKIFLINKKLKKISKINKMKVMCFLEKYELTPSQGMVIGILLNEGKQKISTISEKLFLTKATMSGLIDRLEKKGKIVKEQDEKDKRITYITIDEEFKERISKDNPEKLMCKPFEKATEKEIDQILETLDLIEKILKREEKEND